MRWLKTVTAACLVMQAGAALAQETACRAPLKPMLRIELYFGRNIPGGAGVSERQWIKFMRTELAARFPGGLTVVDGKGQWREGERIVGEASKIVIALAPDDAGTRAAVDAAAAAYKERFRQKSVGIVTQAVCAAF